MDLDPETLLARVGHDVSAAVASDGIDRPKNGSSTRDAVEDTLATLDGGAGAVACSTGTATMSVVASLLDAGAHLLCAHNCAAETKQRLAALADRGSLSVTYVDLSDREALAEAVRSDTEALWVETPSRPHLRIVDLEGLAAFADAHDLRLIVDNTVLSPLLQRPIEHGADLVLYSTMAHLNGHADVEGGAVVARTEALTEDLDRAAQAHEAASAPFDSWLMLRGARTLPVRMQQHETNARSIAYFLHEHPAVDRVCYPGLRDHPGHEVARRQQDGYGSVMSFFVDETQVDAKEVLRSTEVFATAASLGGVESMIQHPATMSHASMTPEERKEAGVTDALVCLSVGIESTDDLTRDLEQALAAARTPTLQPESVRPPAEVEG